MLTEYPFLEGLVAGCDEAGRGCLAGPVYAAAVILPAGFAHPLLNDSKKMKESDRLILRAVIMEQSLAWGVGSCDHMEIDRINILNASFLAMHRAIQSLKSTPQLLLIDGNRFKPFKGIRHTCVVGGDGLYTSVAAASVLAKTFRDDFMNELHNEYPQYGWNRNKAYATATHTEAMLRYGRSPYHRKSFRLKSQLELGI